MEHSCELEFILIKGQPLKINIVPFQTFSYLIFSMVGYIHYSFRWREMSPSDDFRGPNSKVQKIFFIWVVNTNFVILQNYISSHSCLKQISFFIAKSYLYFYILGCITLINIDVIIMIFRWTCSFYDSNVRQDGQCCRFINKIDDKMDNFGFLNEKIYCYTFLITVELLLRG